MFLDPTHCAQPKRVGSRDDLACNTAFSREAVDHPWLAGFLKQLRQEDLSPMTVRGYESDLQSFLRWYESRCWNS